VTPSEQATALASGTERIETPAELIARIAGKRRLTVKLGIDPTGPLLHLGHAVVLHKLQEFVTFGHRVIVLIGDFTARIGDPTGRNDTRPPLTDEGIAHNMREYRAQAGKVLDLERVEVMYNSTWLASLSLDGLIGLLSQSTVAQMLARNDFSERYGSGVPIALHEFLYPIAQAYDSVAMQADVEIGGSDQLFNLLLGREYQHHAGQPKQICLTTPILEGTDGIVRMGKSRGNYIGLTEPAGEQFGKLMSVPDALLPRYAELAAFHSPESVATLRSRLASGSLHPMAAKKDIAEEVVARYHGADQARSARRGFEATVQRGEEPSEMPEIRSPGSWRTVADALVGCGFAASKREAERLVAGRGVKIDGTVVDDPRRPWVEAASTVLSVGTRRFVRVIGARLGPPEG